MQSDDQQLLSALARLSKNSDFDRFMTSYIGGELAEYAQQCIDQDNPGRAQGAAQVLQQIQKDVEDAEQAFLRLTDRREIPLS